MRNEGAHPPAAAVVVVVANAWANLGREKTASTSTWPTASCGGGSGCRPQMGGSHEGDYDGGGGRAVTSYDVVAVVIIGHTRLN